MAKRSSIKIRSKWLVGKLQIRTLIAHPMDNGRHKDQNGNLIAAHYIEKLTVKLNEQIVFEGTLSGSVSKDPFFTFLLKHAVKGDTITISWEDNQQLKDSLDYSVP